MMSIACRPAEKQNTPPGLISPAFLCAKLCAACYTATALVAACSVSGIHLPSIVFSARKPLIMGPGIKFGKEMSPVSHTSDGAA